ncbi:hypothetical protein BWR17_19090 (plasmid) [Phaeobacter inhibens]|uniref:IclR family transcriptional regulator n=1 Tax=Phaeobacter inhibens TaxID=221822 RepID=UPI000971B160|nr:IclR family transcriptional regulator [Phaeobacter inhibens]APX17998.1 hypothetical protein BWR17_19090 [Phaeobacter inhibens]
MNKPKKTNTAPSKTLARGLDILEAVVSANRALRLKDIAEMFEMDMASAYRLTKTLEIKGFITRLPVGKTFGPGPKLAGLADPFGRHKEMLQMLRPIVENLSEKTGQVAHIGVLEDGRVVLTEVALTASARVSVAQSAGDVEDIYCSAIGKALLAYIPEFEANALIRQQPFDKHTETTLTTASALRAELETIRKAGVAFDEREGSDDVACIAVPIRNSFGFAIASIGISSVATTLPNAIYEQFDWIDVVRSSGQRAEELVGLTDE